MSRTRPRDVRWWTRDLCPILVGPSPALTGSERLLAAFRNLEQGEIHLLVETHRSSNRSLLTARHLYIHDDTRRVVQWKRLDSHPLGAHERAELIQWLTGPLGDHIEVIRLGEPHPVADTTVDERQPECRL